MFGKAPFLAENQETQTLIALRLDGVGGTFRNGKEPCCAAKSNLLALKPVGNMSRTKLAVFQFWLYIGLDAHQAGY